MADVIRLTKFFIALRAYNDWGDQAWAGCTEQPKLDSRAPVNSGVDLSARVSMTNRRVLFVVLLSGTL